MNGSTSNGDRLEADRGLDAAKGGELVALFSTGGPDPSGEPYRRITRLLLSKVVAIVRREYDVAWDTVPEDRFLHPGFAVADNRKWDGELNFVVNHCCCKLFHALQFPKSEDFGNLVSHFEKTVVNFARRLGDHSARGGKARSTQVVDGPDGPVRKRVYADRGVSLDASRPHADAYSREIARGLAEDREAEYKALIAKAFVRASSKDRETLDLRLTEQSAEKASVGVGQTGQTVRNRHRSLVEGIDPEIRSKLAMGSSRKVSAKGTRRSGAGGKRGSSSPGRAGEADGPSPRRKPGD